LQVEIPPEPERLGRLRERMKERYPIEQFNTFRRGADPKGILSNKLVDTLFS
jgi:hypothetical protein